MENFISTQTAILLSFLLKKMPNLFKHIVECSTELNVKKPLPETLPVTILSAHQIQEARAHPNTIALYALNAVAFVQGALAATNNKLKDLMQQRSKIEGILVKLMSLEEQATSEEEKSEG